MACAVSARWLPRLARDGGPRVNCPASSSCAQGQPPPEVPGRGPARLALRAMSGLQAHRTCLSQPQAHIAGRARRGMQGAKPWLRQHILHRQLREAAAPSPQESVHGDAPACASRHAKCRELRDETRTASAQARRAWCAPVGCVLAEVEGHFRRVEREQPGRVHGRRSCRSRPGLNGNERQRCDRLASCWDAWGARASHIVEEQEKTSYSAGGRRSQKWRYAHSPAPPWSPSALAWVS